MQLVNRVAMVLSLGYPWCFLDTNDACLFSGLSGIIFFGAGNVLSGSVGWMWHEWCDCFFFFYFSPIRRKNVPCEQTIQKEIRGRSNDGNIQQKKMGRLLFICQFLWLNGKIGYSYKVVSHFMSLSIFLYITITQTSPTQTPVMASRCPGKPIQSSPSTLTNVDEIIQQVAAGAGTIKVSRLH